MTTRLLTSQNPLCNWKNGILKGQNTKCRPKQLNGNQFFTVQNHLVWNLRSNNFEEFQKWLNSFKFQSCSHLEFNEISLISMKTCKNSHKLLFNYRLTQVSRLWSPGFPWNFLNSHQRMLKFTYFHCNKTGLKVVEAWISMEFH